VLFVSTVKVRFQLLLSIVLAPGYERTMRYDTMFYTLGGGSAPFIAARGYRKYASTGNCDSLVISLESKLIQFVGRRNRSSSPHTTGPFIPFFLLSIHCRTASLLGSCGAGGGRGVSSILARHWWRPIETPEPIVAEHMLCEWWYIYTRCGWIAVKFSSISAGEFTLRADDWGSITRQ